MSKELTYLTPEGYTVFTSQYLKNRGTCCKTACLHCPFGFTLKKMGLQFADVKETDSAEVESIMAESGKEVVEWKSFFPDNVKFILIKEKVCGVILKNHIVVKHLYIKPRFQDQGLSKEMVESYYFI